MDELRTTVTEEEYAHIIVKPLARAVGAEVDGVDLRDLNDSAFDEIYAAWLRHHVVVLHDQHITPEQQLEFARRFGDIHQHSYMRRLDVYLEIFEILIEPGDDYTIGSA